MGHRPPHRRPSFGRDTDRDAVRARLAEPGILVVTGLPGIGRPSWSAESRTAGRRRSCRGFDFEGAAHADEVVAPVASALGIGVPTAIGPALRSRGRSLLVVDDAEAAATTLPALLAGWVREAPDLRVLASSRVRLDDTPTWPLPSLDRDAAAALYLDGPARFNRGSRSNRERSSTWSRPSTVCHWPWSSRPPGSRAFRRRPSPDGYPGCWPIPRRSGRHGSLEAALAVSWELLPEDQRLGLTAASVFHGVFDAAAFEQVTGGDPEVLEALLDASLVDTAGSGRVRLLETVRALADARVGPDRRPALVFRHTTWTLETAGSAAVHARSDGDWAVVQRLRRPPGGPATGRRRRGPCGVDPG